MHVTIIGTGYVGLVSGACFAKYGNQVHCVDISESKIKQLQKGQLPIYEPGLEEMVRHCLLQSNLQFSTSIKEAVAQSDIIFLAVGTPDNGAGLTDLAQLWEAAKDLAHTLSQERPRLIVIKSTVPVGTADSLEALILEERKDLQMEGEAPAFDVLNNPEFLREGYAVTDFLKPQRIIVGTKRQASRALMEELYYPFTKEGAKLLFVSRNSAEFVKYACNCFLAMKISYVNEVANICDLVGADYHEVFQGMAADERIGGKFLAAGIGYGGSCLPKDVRAMTATAKKVGYNSTLLAEITQINERQKLRIVQIMQEHFQKKDFKGFHFALWGLAFKANTDDMRDAPSLKIIETLLKSGAQISANDPAAFMQAKKLLGSAINYMGMYECLKDADALLLLTEWPVYQEPDFEKMKSLLKTALVFDGRNIYSRHILEQYGFCYYGVGTNTKSYLPAYH